ncbi:MAG: LuxR C-terminal-related transcriptional regulator [Adlercreutzia equolifaciens]
MRSPRKEARPHRARTVLVPLAKGHTVKSIAEQFTVSFHTVRSQVRSIYLKLGIHSREELLEKLESLP